MSVARTTVTVCLLVIIKLAGHERRVMMETAGLHRCDDTWKIRLVLKFSASVSEVLITKHWIGRICI